MNAKSACAPISTDSCKLRIRYFTGRHCLLSQDHHLTASVLPHHFSFGRMCCLRTFLSRPAEAPGGEFHTPWKNTLARLGVGSGFGINLVRNSRTDPLLVLRCRSECIHWDGYPEADRSNLQRKPPSSIFMHQLVLECVRLRQKVCPLPQ